MDWIEDIIEHTLENYEGRQIVLWGKYEVSKQIKERLMNEYKIENIIYIDTDLNKVDYMEVFPTEYIAGKSKELYVVISFMQSLK